MVQVMKVEQLSDLFPLACQNREFSCVYFVHMFNAFMVYLMLMSTLLYRLKNADPLQHSLDSLLHTELLS